MDQLGLLDRDIPEDFPEFVVGLQRPSAQLLAGGFTAEAPVGFPSAQVMKDYVGDWFAICALDCYDADLAKRMDLWLEQGEKSPATCPTGIICIGRLEEIKLGRVAVFSDVVTIDQPIGKQLKSRVERLSDLDKNLLSSVTEIITPRVDH